MRSPTGTGLERDLKRGSVGGQNSLTLDPTVLLTGELEDPDDETAEAAALMPNGTRFRIRGQGHINAFLKSHLVLPQITAFLAEFLSSPVKA